MPRWTSTAAALVAVIAVTPVVMAAPAHAEQVEVADSAGLEALEAQVVELLDAARAEAGAPPVELDPELVAGAEQWACEGMEEFPAFSEGLWSENLGLRSDDDAGGFHEQWMGFDTTRDIRLDETRVDYGVGVCERDDGTWYAVERLAP